MIAPRFHLRSLMPSCCTDKSQALVPGWQWPLTTSLKVSHPTGLCEQTRHGPHPRVLVSPPWLLPGAGPTYRLLRKHLQRPTVPLKSEAKTLLSKGSKTALANSKGSHPFEESPESRKWNEGHWRASGCPNIVSREGLGRAQSAPGWEGKGPALLPSQVRTGGIAVAPASRQCCVLGSRQQTRNGVFVETQ